MVDECDQVRGMERWMCQLNKLFRDENGDPIFKFDENTGELKVTVNGVEIAAEQINLNTDGLEALLGYIADSNGGLKSGENHIGEVGTNTKILRMNPTVQTSLYASGKCIGGLITLNGAMRKNGGTGLISNLVARIASSTVCPALEITLFSEDPTASTVGDNQVFALADADIGKAVAVFNINKSDYILTGGKYRAKSSDSYQGVESKSDSQNIYAVIVAKEDVTFPSDHALFIKMDNLRD